MIVLKALSKSDLLKVVEWRNEAPETLRTPRYLTKEMQEEYFNNVICNRNFTTMYWGIHVANGIFIEDETGEHDRIGRDEKLHNYEFTGYGGIENIQWSYRIGEISIILDPSKRKKGVGKKAVKAILDNSFNELNLEIVWGEVYYCGAVGFWEKYCKEDKRCFYTTTLPRRKYYNGKYWDSLFFCFSRDGK